MKHLKGTKKYCKKNNLLSIDDLLELIQVEWDLDVDESSPLFGWFGVSNENGIIAYFGTEDEALSYRLNYINRILNG